MESSTEQEILEAAAFHLILLRNPIHQSYNCINEYDSDYGGNFRMKRKLDYGVKSIVNNKGGISLSLSSSSCLSSESIKSGISLEEDEGEGRRHRRTTSVEIHR
ncbi:hypothetical protein HanRHA438_Chr10g0455301 [Helianthus annuus]|nr:hypothetical protein HanRHA438_Chr10g0455301 [Helianthus annuus]